MSNDRKPHRDGIKIGVIDPIKPEVETPETFRGRIIEAAVHLPLNQLGTTNDCGFSPFGWSVPGLGFNRQ